MQQALTLAAKGVELGHGGPFGAVVVIEERIVGEGWNRVVERNDPTAHAEILAIREATTRLGRYHLPEATLYTTCEPCPMCLGALYWTHIGQLIFAATAEDAAEFGFDDRRIRDALRLPLENQPVDVVQRYRAESRALFQRWLSSDKRVDY